MGNNRARASTVPPKAAAHTNRSTNVAQSGRTGGSRASSMAVAGAVLRPIATGSRCSSARSLAPACRARRAERVWIPRAQQVEPAGPLSGQRRRRRARRCRAPRLNPSPAHVQQDAPPGPKQDGQGTPATPLSPAGQPQQPESLSTRAAQLAAEAVASPIFYLAAGLLAIKLVSSTGDSGLATFVFAALPITALTGLSKSSLGKQVGRLQLPRGQPLCCRAAAVPTYRRAMR
jgi:hypothetical protein